MSFDEIVSTILFYLKLTPISDGFLNDIYPPSTRNSSLGVMPGEIDKFGTTFAYAGVLPANGAIAKPIGLLLL